MPVAAFINLFLTILGVSKGLIYRRLVMGQLHELINCVNGAWVQCLFEQLQTNIRHMHLCTMRHSRKEIKTGKDH